MGRTQKNQRVYLLAGDLKLDWVSVRDVAEVCVAALTENSQKTALSVTSGRLLGFHEVCEKINDTIGTSLKYKPATLWGFIAYSRTGGAQWSYILITLLLHFLPRFSAHQGVVLGELQEVLGREAESVEKFAERNAQQFRRLL